MRRILEPGNRRGGTIESYGRDELARLLAEARDQGATEVHFKVPSPPLFRIGGKLQRTEHPKVLPQAAHQIATSLCALAGIEVPLARIHEYEFSFGLTRVGRFRAALYRQRGTLAAIVQRSALKIPELSDLGLDPSDVDPLLEKPGMMLVTGDRRAAMVAALVERYNVTRHGYVVTLEDPITYLHADSLSLIAQRGVGTDIEDKAQGLRAVRRQQPDLIAVHSVEDAEAALETVVTAEHRFPVIASVGATSAAEALTWLARLRPFDERDDFRERLAQVTVASFVPSDDAYTIDQQS